MNYSFSVFFTGVVRFTEHLFAFLLLVVLTTCNLIPFWGLKKKKRAVREYSEEKLQGNNAEAI